MPPRNKRPKKTQLISGAFLIAVTLAWSFAAGYVVYYATSKLVGLNPILLLFPVFGLGIAVVTIVALFSRHWYFAIAGILSTLLIVLFFCYGTLINDWAWNRSIQQYQTANIHAVTNAPPLPEVDGNEVSDWVRHDEKLPALSGFTWYTGESTASSDGSYRGFSHRGLVFVRINKIPNGYTGLIYLPTPEDISRLETPYRAFKYTKTDDPHWLIWWL